MLGYLEVVVWVVGMGILVGGTSVIAFMWWFGKRMERIKSTEGRCYQDAAKFDNTAKHRDDEATTGGAMGYPKQQIGEETLRMVPMGADIHILRQHGDVLVAKIVVASREVADGVFGVLQRQMEAGGVLPPTDTKSPRDVLEVVMQFAEGDRRLVVLHCQQGTKVIEFVGKIARSVARVANDTHGRELFALLLGQSAAIPAEHRDHTPNSIAPAMAEPCLGGSLGEASGTPLGVDFVLADVDEEVDDPLWNQLFQ